MANWYEFFSLLENYKVIPVILMFLQIDGNIP